MVVSRTGLGIALVIAAGLAFLQATGALSAARDVLLAAFVVAVVLGVIFAPWIVRLVRSLSAERAERIRSQERAEMAAHLHDSVLQTLALVQQQADDPRQVSPLARQQERELRSWLSGRPAPGQARQVAAALEAAAEEVEERHGVHGRRGDGGRPRAGRRARGARGGGARGHGECRQVRRRDRRWRSTARPPRSACTCSYATAARASTPPTYPADRRGVRESIVGRMERHGGRARSRARPATAPRWS